MIVSFARQNRAGPSTGPPLFYIAIRWERAMMSSSESKAHSPPSGSDLQSLMEHANHLRATETARMLRRLLGMKPLEDERTPLPEMLPKDE